MNPQTPDEETAGRASGPSCGRFEGRTHVLPVRVYYQDTDAGGIVYHANYLAFFERARSEMLRLLGIDHAAAWRETETPDERVGLAVAEARLVFRAPAVLDDALVVRTQIRHLGAAYVDVAQAAMRDGRLLVRLEIRVALIDGRGRVRRLPAAWRTAMEPWLVAAGDAEAERLAASQARRA